MGQGKTRKGCQAKKSMRGWMKLSRARVEKCLREKPEMRREKEEEGRASNKEERENESCYYSCQFGYKKMALFIQFCYSSN